MLIKGFDLGFKDADTKQGIVTGYFAMFGNKDLDGDIIDRGAFSKSIQERGPGGKQLIKYLLDHDKTKVVAKVKLLQEDEKGLYYEGKIGSHNAGQDFLKMVESELINQHSFGYRVIKDEYDPLMKATRFKEVYLYEGSAMQFLGANPETSIIGLKSFEDALDYFDRLEKFIKTTDCTDETIIQLELRLKSLSALLKPDNSTLIDKEAENKIKELFKTFGNNGY